MYIENILDREIDHGFFKVSKREAAILAKESSGELPSVGRERLVIVNDTTAWLSRTVVNGTCVWAVHGGELGEKIFNEAVRKMLTGGR